MISTLVPVPSWPALSFSVECRYEQSDIQIALSVYQHKIKLSTTKQVCKITDSAKSNWGYNWGSYSRLARANR